MGRHRTLENVRRGVAKWPVVVLGVVALLALAWLGWTWINDRIEQRAAIQSKSCPEGDSVLRVAVTPSAATAVEEAAKRWNVEKTVVADHCVRVEVTAQEPSQVFTGLSGDWNPEAMGGKPQAVSYTHRQVLGQPAVRGRWFGDRLEHRVGRDESGCAGAAVRGRQTA